MARNIVAIKGSFAAGHVRPRMTHGAGKAFHGLGLAFGQVGTSLTAEKELLEEEFFLISLWLRTAELNHYMDVMRSIQRDSSFFAGIAFRNFQGLASMSRHLNTSDSYAMGLDATLLMFSIATYGVNLLVVFLSGHVKIYAPVARLLGPSHVNDTAIDHVIDFKTRAFRFYTGGMLLFFVTAILTMMRKPVMFAVPVCVIIGLVAITFLFYAYDIRHRFDLPENRLTTGKVHFFHSKPTNPMDNGPKTDGKAAAIQQFCTECGAAYDTVSQKFCSNCGSESLRDAKLQGIMEADEKEEKPKRAQKSRNTKDFVEEAELASLV